MAARRHRPGTDAKPVDWQRHDLESEPWGHRLHSAPVRRVHAPNHAWGRLEGLAPEVGRSIPTHTMGYALKYLSLDVNEVKTVAADTVAAERRGLGDSEGEVLVCCWKT